MLYFIILLNIFTLWVLWHMEDAIQKSVIEKDTFDHNDRASLDRFQDDISEMKGMLKAISSQITNSN